jgi:hypothetical protein
VFVKFWDIDIFDFLIFEKVSKSILGRLEGAHSVRNSGVHIFICGFLESVRFL